MKHEAALLNSKVVPAALLACAVCLVYLRSLRNDFVYDDFRLIADAEPVRTPGQALAIFAEPHFPTVPYYRPATKLTFRIQKAFCGSDPAAYHAFNMALAAGAGLAFFAILMSRPFSFGPWPAFLASLAWIIHPAASSCVYPAASGRETLLPALFILAGLFAHLRSGPMWRATALLSFAVAIFSREQAIVMPVALATADILNLSEDPPGRRWKEWAARYAPMAIVGAEYFLLRSAAIGGRYTIRFASCPAAEMIGSFLYALQTAFTPYFELKYEPSTASWFSASRIVISAALVCAMLVFSLRLAANRKRHVAFWIVWWILMLLPTANILLQETRHDERYVFLASAALAGIALETWLGLPNPRLRACAALLALATAILWGGASWRRADTFRDDISFLSQWTATDPDNPYPHYYLGTALADAGCWKEASRFLERAVALKPDFAEATYNLGNARLRLGQPHAAVMLYRRTLSLRPGHIGALCNLGAALVSLGRNEEAVSMLRQAVHRNPSNADARYNLGVALASAGLRKEAERQFRETLRRHPDRADARHNLSILLEQPANQ